MCSNVSKVVPKESRNVKFHLPFHTVIITCIHKCRYDIIEEKVQTLQFFIHNVTNIARIAIYSLIIVYLMSYGIEFALVNMHEQSSTTTIAITSPAMPSPYEF